MRHLIGLALVAITLGLNAQELKMRDFLGANKQRLISEIQSSSNYTEVEIVNGDTLHSLYDNKIDLIIIFRQDKVFMQYICYPRDMSNTVMKYLMDMVAIEPRELYVNFNVDPPSFYKLLWEKDYLILSLYE